MVKHIVMWKLADEAEGASKNSNAKKIRELLYALKTTIPQIKKIEVGMNLRTGDEYAYDLALYSEFETVDDLEIYKEHPEHKKVSAFVSKVKTDRAFVDYIE